MSRLLLPIALVAGLVGCSNDSMTADIPSGTDNQLVNETAQMDGDPADAPAYLRLDVTPPSGLLSLDGLSYLPQTWLINGVGGVENLALSPPVVFSGVVHGYAVAPYRSSDLPGSDGAIGGALVSVRRGGSLQSANDVTSDDPATAGAFRIVAVPDSDYIASFVPADPDVPFRSGPLDLSSRTDLDVDLGYGTAVWGTVYDDVGEPLRGAYVRAVAADGIAGAAAITDADGSWLLRVEPGTWTIRCDGRAGGRDPVLTSGVVDVPDEGLDLHFAYPSLAPRSIGGRVVDDNGHGVPSVRVRFAATGLDGYPASTTYDVEVLTNSDGNYDARLLPGTYAADVVPDRTVALSALSLGEVDVAAAFEDLGTTVLPSFVSVGGTVVDPTGLPVANAVVAFQEDGFSGRSWTATTGASGEFALAAPHGPLIASIAPPPERAELALTRARLELSATVAPVLAFQQGTQISGVVTAPGSSGAIAPVPFAIVEVLDDDGLQWGVALTDAQGAYAVRVAWTP